MALDSANKRFSALHLASPWRGVNYFPTGTVSAPERLAVMHYGSSISAGAPTVHVGAGAVYIFQWIWSNFEKG